MYEGRMLFPQLMDFLPRDVFRACVNQHVSVHRARPQPSGGKGKDEDKTLFVIIAIVVLIWICEEISATQKGKSMDRRKTLQMTIPLTPEYANAFLNIIPTNVDLSLDLRDGAHRVTTNPVEVGRLKQFGRSPVAAQLTIWYEYVASDNALVLCDNDLVSLDTMHITIGTDNNMQNMVQFAHGAIAPQQEVDDGIFNSPLTFNFQKRLKGCLQQANAILIGKAKGIGLVVLLRSELPELPEDAYQRMSPIYRNGEFVEFFDPAKTYGPEYSMKGLRSIFGGIVTFPPDQDFANVIGSTFDPHGDKEYRTWIGLWESKTGCSATICSSFGFPAYLECNTGKQNIIGGHVIFGQKARPVAKGGIVYIIPICKRHNSNNTCSMRPTKNNLACWMRNYMEA